MLNHGGELRKAAARYHIPLSDWIDLSTGVNPRGYPVPPMSPKIWNRLPENDDGLVEAATEYYNCSSLVPVAGSQAAIQALPVIRELMSSVCPNTSPENQLVAIPDVGYREHAHAWRQKNYQLITYSGIPDLATLQKADVVVVINPNNPTARRIKSETILQWHSELRQHGGWLVLDEAFVDCTPECSLSRYAPRPGLIILRSVGKFFGLAGIRAGFVLAEQSILQSLQEYSGPWPISGPSREVCKQALQDSHWQDDNRSWLLQNSKRLQRLLEEHFDHVRCTSLFGTVMVSNATYIHEQLCHQGILTRLLDEKNGIRFGLPASEPHWQKLKHAIQAIVPV